MEKLSEVLKVFGCKDRTIGQQSKVVALEEEEG